MRVSYCSLPVRRRGRRRCPRRSRPPPGRRSRPPLRLRCSRLRCLRRSRRRHYVAADPGAHNHSRADSRCRRLTDTKPPGSLRGLSGRLRVRRHERAVGMRSGHVCSDRRVVVRRARQASRRGLKRPLARPAASSITCGARTVTRAASRVPPVRSPRAGRARHAQAAACVPRDRHATARSVAETCAAGSYSPGPGASNCTACGAGETSEAGATQCVFCLAGTYLSENGGCVDCGADDLWSANQAASCEPCIGGSFTSGGTGTRSTHARAVLRVARASLSSARRVINGDERRAAATTSTAGSCNSPWRIRARQHDAVHAIIVRRRLDVGRRRDAVSCASCLAGTYPARERRL